MTSTLLLDIPALEDPDAIVGGGCCFVRLDDLIRDELRSWHGVEEIDIDGRQVLVHVTGRRPTPDDLADSLAALGVDVQVANEPSKRP